MKNWVTKRLAVSAGLDDEIIQICIIIDVLGKVLFESLVRPPVDIEPEASDIPGITIR